MRQGPPDEHSTFGIPRAGRTRAPGPCGTPRSGCVSGLEPRFPRTRGQRPGRGRPAARLDRWPGLTGHFWYAAIEPGRIVTRWEVSRFAELGTGVLAQQDSRSRVVHEFVQAGLLAAALAPAYSGAASQLGPRSLRPRRAFARSTTGDQWLPAEEGCAELPPARCRLPAAGLLLHPTKKLAVTSQVRCVQLAVGRAELAGHPVVVVEGASPHVGARGSGFDE